MKKSDTITRKEINQIALDIGIQQKSEGLLVFLSGPENYRKILKKPFRSAHYSVIFSHEGEMSLRINMFDYVLSGHKVFFASPSAIKEFKNLSDDCLLTVILFTDEYIRNTLLGQSYTNFLNCFVGNTHFFIDADGANFEDLKQLALMLEKRIGRKRIGKVENLIFLAMLNVVDELLEKQDAVSPRETTSKRGNLVLNFLKLLPQHIRTHRDIGFYAHELNVNPKYLSQTLKEKTGKTASSHIADMVILEAKVLLNTPTYSIAKVSEALRFPDQFTFSKYFKRYSGMTPSTCRAEKSL